MQPIHTISSSKYEPTQRATPYQQSRLSQRETRENTIKWQENANRVNSAQSDFNRLRGFQNVLLSLVDQFNLGNQKVGFTDFKQNQFEQRLLLLESEIQGLLRRKIDYVFRGQGDRVLDYTGILNQKENQIVELEKKINNLEERLRRATARQYELQNEVARLFQEIKKKETIISLKNDIILGQVAASNLFKEAMQRAGLQIPNVGSLQIRADTLTAQGAGSRTSAYQQLPENKKNKIQLIQLFRQFQKINSNQGITTEQIERSLQGFFVSLEGSKLRESVETRIRRRQIQQNYNRLKEQFGAAISIMDSFLKRIKVQIPSFNMNLDTKIFEMLKEHKINVYKVAGDILNLESVTQKTIEVPVQDARTKHLLHLFARELKKLTLKYPKLQLELGKELSEFFQQELIDLIEVDQIDRLIQIVKYEPQIVKVENVYAYSSEKSRKVQFHLRVLIKALLEELEKIKQKTGVILQMDEGVIAMIRQQIMGIVNVDDILKTFRVVPKIVEVEKVIEKIVDKIVEVPQVVTVDKITEKIVQIEKIKEVQKIINVPLEIPVVVTNIVEKIVTVQKIVQRIIEVPQVIERFIEVVKQVPKIVEVEKIVEKIVEIQKVVQVEKVQNYIQFQIKQVPVIKEVTVYQQQKTVQKIVEVPVVVEKIVEKVVQIPQIIEIQKIVEKIVPQIEYRNAKQIVNHVEVRYEIVDRIVEKPITIIQTVQKLIEVPQVVQKIIQTNTIIRDPYEVQVIREKIIVQDKIREIQVIKEKLVVVNKEVIKEVQKIVQIPFIQDRIVKVTEIIEKPIIQRSQSTIIKEVYLRDPQIIMEPKIVEVQKIINHFIEVPKPVKYIEQKIVEVIRHVDRIKQVKVPVQKIIEKMVQVPKVVEIERIVEKIVVVPRVVEKVIEVPQIIQKIVPKIIVQEIIKQVEKIVQVPVFQDKPIQIENIKNVYIQVEKTVDRIVDKLVQVPKYEERIVNNEVIIEKIVEVIKEVPKQIEVEKIVYTTIEVAKPVDVERQVVVPIEVPIPVEKVIERIVPVTEIVDKIVQVPQIVEKIVAQRVEQIRIEQVVRVEQKVVVDQLIKEVTRQVPYISERIKEVTVERQKIVPIQSIVQQIITAKQIVEKVVEKTITVPKIQQVERTKEIVVEVPKIVEVERITPQLINVNKYIQKIVQKIVEVPIIIEQIKEIVRENEKIVQVKSQYETVKEVERVVQKAVIMQKFKEVVRNINHIEKVLQIVDRYEQTPVPIISYEEKFVEVPYILEKIVEKIVVMPQIVEVLKYVHEVVEQETLGVAVDVEFATHEQKYKIMTANLKSNISVLLTDLRKLRNSNPALGVQIEGIEKFLTELEKFILFPRIVQIPKQVIVEKIVEKDRIVTLPTQNERSIKMQLTLSLLVEKLILQLKKIKQANPTLNLQLEDDVKLIFFSELDSYPKGVGDEFNKRLKQFGDSVYRKFQSLGHWSHEHQLMLNSFLQERFIVANMVKNANSEIQKSRALSLQQEEKLKLLTNELRGIKQMALKMKGMRGIESFELNSLVEGMLERFMFIESKPGFVEAMVEKSMILGDVNLSDERIRSLIRQKDLQIQLLKDQITKIQATRTISTASESQSEIIRILQVENLKLKNQINELRLSKGSEELVKQYRDQIKAYEAKILQLENEKSELASKLSNLQREYDVKMQLSKQFAEIEIKSSKMQNLSSPVHSYNIMSSPKQNITMVQSQIKNVSDTPGTSFMKDNKTSADKSISGSAFSGYRSPSDHESTVREPGREGYSSTTKFGATLTDSNRLGTQQAQSTIYQPGSGTYNLGSSQQEVAQSSYGTYQVGQSGIRPTTYDSSLYQSGLSSSYQSSPYQSGLYQAGQTQGQTQGTTQPSVYQAGTYRPIQGYQPYQPLGGASGASGASGTGGYTASTFKSSLNTQQSKQQQKK